MIRVEVIPPAGPLRAFKRSRYRLLERVIFPRATVPAGFVTDGATLPPGIRGWLDPMGEWGRAAILHDWLLHCGVPRQMAAHEFREQMKADKVTPAARQVFYWAVRAWDVVRGK